MIQKMISMALVTALVVGMVPTLALASEEPQVDEPAIAISSDPVLGVQSGVEPAQPEAPRQPRSLEELMALDCVILSEDGMPIAVKGSMEDISMEEMEILFGGSPAMMATLDEDDPNRELREQFGLTDTQIEKGTELHGSRLAYTNQLGDLVVKAEGMDLTEEQVTTLADLISWGYTCPQATRALVSKDLFGLALDELRAGKAAEIEAAWAEEGSDQMEKVGSEGEYLAGKLGLPQSLAETVLETSGKDVQTLVQEMSIAMETAYPIQADGQEAALMTAATTGNTYYAPEEVLGQPYSYDQQGNFDININNGSYSYTETDLNIPGKNGLDLVLTRQFHSDQANTMTTMGGIYSGASGIAFRVYYRWYELEYDEELGKNIIIQELTDHEAYRVSDTSVYKTWDYPISWYEQAVAKKESLADDIGSRSAVWDLRYGVQHIITVVPTITTVNTVFENKAYHMEQEDNFYVDEFGLGHGWMLGLSHLRAVPCGYGDWEHPKSKFQLTLSDGTRYNIVEDSLNGDNLIENYPYDDIMFRLCEPNEYPNAMYGIYHKDGKVEYLNSAGRNIAIRDRFGNTITIAYTLDSTRQQVKKIEITDTVGNLVTYEEIALDSAQNYYLKGRQYQYNKLWRLSLNDAMVREYYSYCREYVLGSGTVEHPTTLVGVRNAAAEVTTYDNEVMTARCNNFLQPNTREFSGPLYANDGYNTYVAMHRIDYPNGGQDIVGVNASNIKQLGYNGYCHYYRLTGVRPINSADDDLSCILNTYFYGDFDGLEGRAGFEQSYHTKVCYGQRYHILNQYGNASDDFESLDKYDLTYDFNLSNQNTKVTKLSYSAMPGYQDGFTPFNVIRAEDQTSWISQTTEYQYENKDSRQPNEIKTVYTDETSGSGLTRVEKYTYDKKGNILTYTKPNGQEVTYTYDGDYSVLRKISQNQNANTTIVTTNTLSADNKSILSTEVSSNGALVGKTVYRYDSYGQLIAQDDYRDATNYVTTAYTYDYTTEAMTIQATVSGVRTADGTTYAASTPGFDQGTIARKQTYNKRGWLMSETDANGNTTSYTYDAVGRLTGAALPDGTSVSYSYDVPNNAVTYTDQAGNQWKCTYGKSGKLLSASIYPSNQSILRNIYDQYDQLVKESFLDTGKTTYYRYDTDGNLIEKMVDGWNKYQELYTYEQGAGKTTKTVVGDANAPSVVTTSYQDNMGNVVKTGSFCNGVEEFDEFAYDYLGNQTQARTAFSAAKGCITATSTYDYAGRLLSVADANGNTAAKTYDWQGNLLTSVNPKDNTNNDKTKYMTTYTYDALGRVLRVESPIASGHTGRTDYTYDPNGNVTQERTLTGAKGDTASARVTNYTYDNMNRLTQVQGNAKQEGQTGTARYQYTTYTYDALGNIAQMSVGGADNKHTTTYTYDRYSHPTKKIDAMGQTEIYDYDRTGNLISTTDRRGVKTTYSRDAMGRVTSIWANGDSVSFTYTKTSQRRTATANGETTTYTYDDRGNLIQEVTPVATKTMTYGIGDLRASLTVTADGVTYLNNQYTYNKLGQLTKVNSGNIEAHYSYDSNGNLASTTNGNGTTANYSYNKADLVTEVKNKRSIDLSNFKYTYGADGNQLTKADTRPGLTSQTSYTYDGLNRLTLENRAEVVGAFSAYAYDDYGNRASLTAGNGTVSTYAYDANDRLLSDANASYTYDANGNLTQTVLGAGSAAQTVTCTYDNFNRLKKVSDNTGETVYTYDADGLRSSKTTGGGTERYVWDGGQLVVTLQPTPQCLYNGTIPDVGTAELPVGLNLGDTYYVEIDGTVYRAKAVIGEDVPSLFVLPLDGPDDGQPEVPILPDPDEPPATFDTYASLEVGGVTIYSVDGGATGTVEGPAGTVVKLYTNDPRKLTTSHVRGLGLIASRTSQGLTYYHYDAHGDVVQLTDATGALVKDYTYDAFGVEQNADDGDMNPFRYCGEQYDGETGNYYLRARYYTPGVGRFTQEDPVRDGLNWYTYCSGNPVGFVDPSGLFGSNTKLKYGEAGNLDVVVLQGRLAQLGYLDMREITPGGFDAATLRAVNKYKEDSGLWNFGEYHGVVGETTWTHMGLTINNTIEVGGNFGTPEANARLLYGIANGPELYLPILDANSNETVWQAGNSAGNKGEIGITIFSGEAGVLKENFSGRYAGAGIDVFHVDGKLKATNESIGAGAVAELVGAQGNVNIPIFWSGYDIRLTGELVLGGVGAEAGWNREKGIGAKIDIGVGAGAYINIKKSP